MRKQREREKKKEIQQKSRWVWKDRKKKCQEGIAKKIERKRNKTKQNKKRNAVKKTKKQKNSRKAFGSIKEINQKKNKVERMTKIEDKSRRDCK